MPEQRHAVICHPTENYAPAVPNSTREYCEICGTEVWMSPESKLAGGEGLMALCTDCAPGVIRAEAEPIFLRPTAGQLAELRRWGGRRRE